MKLLFAPLLSLILSTFAIALPDSQILLAQDGQDTKVPGASPLEHCTSSTSNDLLTIESVDLDPNPPVPGQTLTVTAKGTFKEDIEDGATVMLTVKYGSFIKLINKNASLCESIKSVDMECPLKKGPTVISKSVDLPAVIPPGDYHVHANCVTKNDEPITCLQADIAFT
ncbi:MAG: Phosphatidylglycerol/phosphatidylinositol transfer protein [Vezdaea aestivalis]|nr:MAG: Phosphatidylglycerol/phosphatidylinositol transfer protein [Vezdaea aestivalis]